MPDNSLDDQLKQRRHADQIASEHEVMKRTGMTRAEVRARVKEASDAPIAPAPAAQPMPMIAMAGLKLDGEVLSLDPKLVGDEAGTVILIAGNKDGRPGVFTMTGSFSHFLA